MRNPLGNDQLADLKQRMDRCLQFFLAGPRGEKQFRHYCSALGNCMAGISHDDLQSWRVQRAVGAYVINGLIGIRGAGRPSRSIETADLFEFVLERVEVERNEANLPPYRRTPLKKIAAYCARHGLGSFHEDQIRYALKVRRKAMRTGANM